MPTVAGCQGQCLPLTSTTHHKDLPELQSPRDVPPHNLAVATSMTSTTDQHTLTPAQRSLISTSYGMHCTLHTPDTRLGTQYKHTLPVAIMARQVLCSHVGKPAAFSPTHCASQQNMLLIGCIQTSPQCLCCWECT
jgi:hypothetical protein